MLLIIEMLADKIPAVNHINDLIQTFIRPVAGAILFAASANVITHVHPLIALACGLIIAGSIHVVKAAAVRPLVTAATAGTGNIPVSITEDVIATVLSILSVVIPILAGILLVLVVAFIIWWFWRRSIRKHQAAA